MWCVTCLHKHIIFCYQSYAILQEGEYEDVRGFSAIKASEVQLLSSVHKGMYSNIKRAVFKDNKQPADSVKQDLVAKVHTSKQFNYTIC